MHPGPYNSKRRRVAQNERGKQVETRAAIRRPIETCKWRKKASASSFVERGKIDFVTSTFKTFVFLQILLA